MDDLQCDYCGKCICGDCASLHRGCWSKPKERPTIEEEIEKIIIAGDQKKEKADSVDKFVAAQQWQVEEILRTIQIRITKAVDPDSFGEFETGRFTEEESETRCKLRSEILARFRYSLKKGESHVAERFVGKKN